MILLTVLQTKHFTIGSLMERGVRLIGNGQAPVHLYWEKLLKYIQEDKIHPLSMLSHRVLIDDMEEIYHMYDRKDDNMQKVRDLVTMILLFTNKGQIFVTTAASAPPAPGTPELKRFNA